VAIHRPLLSPLRSYAPPALGLPWDAPLGGGASPPSVAGLIALLGSRLRRLNIGGLTDGTNLTLVGGKVSAWADQSGNGYTMVQGNDADRPGSVVTIDGKSCPLFGVQDFLARNAGTLADEIDADGYRRIEVLRPDIVAGDSANPYTNDVASGDSGAVCGSFFRNVSGTTPSFGAWHYDGAFKTTALTATPTGAVYLCDTKYNGTTLQAKAGLGAFQDVTAGNVAILTGVPRIGYCGVGTGYIQGAVCFVCVCDDALTDAEATYVRALAKALFPSAVGT
jgi:hypothetical protein